MFKRLHIPAGLAGLALLGSAAFGEDRVLVTVAGDVHQLAQRHHLGIVRSLPGTGRGVHVVSVPPGSDVQQVMRQLAGEASVRSVEPDKPMKLPGLSSPINPNPTGSRLSSVRLDGTQVYYFNSFAAAAYVNQQAATVINLAKAQTLANGDGVKVAIVDTGIDRTHPVLANSIGDGFDFVNNLSGGQEKLDVNQETTPILDQETTPILDQETTPILDGGSAVILKQETTPILDQETTPILDSTKYPAYGHGTMVAGLVHLVAPKARLLAARAFGANGAATVSQVVAAIYWAVDRGADVINMSFSTTQDSPALSTAINYAISKGAICVAAAGNDGATAQVWPAAYSNVIGVGSTNNFLVRSLFSNYGTPLVSLAAPGEGDVTVYPGSHYAQVWGTSFSTPLVAGGAALLVDQRDSTDASRAAAALAHAKYIGQELGAGELDLFQAVLSIGKKN